MPEREGSSYREAVAIACVLLAHGALVWLFVVARAVERTTDAGAAPSMLLFIELALERPETRTPAIEVRILASPPPIPAPPQLPQIQEATPPDRAPRLIDWRDEAQRSASSVIEHSRAPGARSFAPSARAPVQAKERTFEWNPEPQRVGISGLMPYVRVGKRCVIGLGFFACGIGDLPAANGELFDGMDDPQRPDSSVPGINP